MNSSLNTSASLGQDAPMAQGNGTGYASDQWSSMGPYSQSSYNNTPMTEFGAFGGYLHHGMPSETLPRMPPPPVQPQTHHPLIQPAPLMGHHQLPMLNTQWPSQLTNPTPSGSFSAPPLSIPPVSLPPVDVPRLPIQYEKARKTLSAEQKRAMCQYHEENPGTRQADIGARFGVERSTVSKVLRHKDQYLKRDPELDQTAGKRGKGKYPDFDRTLSNYVRRQQQRGFDVKDEDIMEQARLFAHGSSNQENLLATINSGWLQKFKQKHGIGAGRFMRRASETNIPDSITMSTALRNYSTDRTTSIISPISPTQQLSPLSGSRSDEDIRGDGLDFDFPYRNGGSHSSTSLISDLRENSAPFSGDAISPTAPAQESFHFSTETNAGAFSMADKSHQLSEERNHACPPSISVDYAHHLPGPSPDTPRRASVPFALDISLTSPPLLRRSSSNSSMTARSNNASIAESSVSSTTADSSPVSPTPEDARRAANTLLMYFQSLQTSSQLDQSEYMAFVQLTKKLQIQQHHTLRPPNGGLSRIPEGDGEQQRH